MRNKSIKIIVVIVLLIFYGISIIAAYRMGYRKGDIEKTRFWAKIEKIDLEYQNIYVKGSPVNDINHRDAYCFQIEADTIIREMIEENLICMEDLKMGDTVYITYTGDVLETSPATLLDVVKVERFNED